MNGMLSCRHYFEVLTGKTKDRLPGLAKEELLEAIMLSKEYLLLEGICHECIDFFKEMRDSDEDNIPNKRNALDGMVVLSVTLAQMTQLDPANAVTRSPKIWKQLLLERDPISELFFELRYEEEDVPEGAWRNYVLYVTSLLRIFEDKDVGKTTYGQYVRCFYLEHGPQLMRALVKVFETAKSYLPYHGLLHRLAQLEVFERAFRNEKAEVLDLFISPLEECGIIKLCIWKFSNGDIKFLDFPRALLENERTAHVVEKNQFYENAVYWVFDHHEFGKSRLEANVLIEQFVQNLPTADSPQLSANKSWFISFLKLINSVPPYVFDFFLFECFCENRRNKSGSQYTGSMVVPVLAPILAWMCLRNFGVKLNKNLVGCMIAEMSYSLKNNKVPAPRNLNLQGNVLNLPEDSKFLAAGLDHAIANPSVKEDDMHVALGKFFVPNAKSYTSKQKAQYFYEEMSCGECLKPSKSLSCCSKCKMTHYCSKECQVAGWMLHKRLCASLATLNMVATKEMTVEDQLKLKQERLMAFRQSWKNTDPTIFPLAKILKAMPGPPIDFNPATAIEKSLNALMSISSKNVDQNFKGVDVEGTTQPYPPIMEMVQKALANQLSSISSGESAPIRAAAKQPVVPAGSSGEASAVCEYCGKVGARMTCGRCHKVRYCNRDCQAVHWAKHKTECA